MGSEMCIRDRAVCRRHWAEDAKMREKSLYSSPADLPLIFDVVNCMPTMQAGLAACSSKGFLNKESEQTIRKQSVSLLAASQRTMKTSKIVCGRLCDVMI